MTKSANRKCGKRGRALLAIASLICLSLSGCLWSATNDFPMFMRSSGGQLDFLWCGRQTETFGYLEVTAGSGDNEIDISGEGIFSLARAEKFGTAEPPGLVQFDGEIEYVPRRGDSVAVYIGESRENLHGIWPRFAFDSSGPTPDGKWISTSNVLVDTPC